MSYLDSQLVNYAGRGVPGFPTIVFVVFGAVD